jgi:cytochrome bd ubiquinol oxidase subunit II
LGTLWFWIVVATLVAYVVLDGFDLGVGIIFPFVAKTEDEKCQALQAIGPVWDGNEVWLLAAAGTLFFAFPLVYASAFSGFYMPLTIVLWLLILRGLAIELRGHVQDFLWRSFWDKIFVFASSLLTIFFGAALANVIRGVPIGPDNYFYLPLWTNWRTGPHPGILDWYTVLGGAMALIALAIHGALYLAYKTEHDLFRRSHRLANRLILPIALSALICIPATIAARPHSLANYTSQPVSFWAPITVLLSLVLMFRFSRKGRALKAFLASCVFLTAMICGAAAGLFPALLPSSIDTSGDITIVKALAASHGLHVGLVWWSIGILLASMYFGIVYWLFRGKVSAYADIYGH